MLFCFGLLTHSASHIPFLDSSILAVAITNPVQYLHVLLSIYISCEYLLYPAQYLHILRRIYISCAVFIIFCAVFINLVQYLHILHSIYYILCSIYISGAAFTYPSYLFYLRQMAPINGAPYTLRISLRRLVKLLRVCLCVHKRALILAICSREFPRLHYNNIYSII